MKKAPLSSTEIPTALPGFEDDDARKKLLLENSSEQPEDTADEENTDVEKAAAEPRKRRRRVVRAFATFAVFICILVVGIAWFFGMGWFSKPQTHAVNRMSKQETQTPPVTEDEKLKMALSMVAPPAASASTVQPDNPGVRENSIETTGVPDLKADTGYVSPKVGSDHASYSLPQAAETPASTNAPSSNSQAVAPEREARGLSNAAYSDDARGRSLFFGIPKKPAKEDEIDKPAKAAALTEVSEVKAYESLRPAQIPFGTLLPVRLVGSIYTLRNSGGFVRMELARPVEGNGYSYPAGTMIVGNVRDGESARAFVNIVGLIDPSSGELVRFSGELLGNDGGSGIEGRRRNLTSQWARFFRGIKDTAASVLGSVGALRSGGTVILSEPLRRGSESITGELSGAILKSDREDTFLEVAAGANGYVLVTGLPENSAAAVTKPAPEAAKK